jgi:hypothetical protein
MGREAACRAAVSMAPPPARALLVLAAALTGKLAHNDETTGVRGHGGAFRRLHVCC